MEWPEFHDLVRDALTNLYDFAHLQKHPLLALLSPDETVGTMARVNALRDLILQTIELLAPDDHIPQSAREWRPYLALRYAYVEYLDADEVQARLGLGERQVMRERGRGIESVAQMLWERALSKTPKAASSAPSAQEAAPTSVDNELAGLGIERELLFPSELVSSALAAVRPMALQRGITLRQGPIAEQPIVADKTLLRQAMIAVLGIGIQQADGGIVEVALRLEATEMVFSASWAGAEEQQLDQTWPSVQALVAVQDGHCHLDRSGARTTLSFSLPQRASERILVIDDNASSLRLMERLLSSGGYRVLTAADGQEGLDLAQKERPSLVLLDVMMRGMDGWEVLLKLKALPETRHIPVLVCSVLPEIELALALGASDLVQKPLRRPELLKAVREALSPNHSSA